ncbi:hypothetical protein SAVCW2_00040 [Streptomyces avermitilis]|nr:hypothetical protein SAVCW2_00040 [Streptomyces avermitilis]
MPAGTARHRTVLRSVPGHAVFGSRFILSGRHPAGRADQADPAADLLEAEAVASVSGEEERERAVDGTRPVRPVPRREGPRRMLPPN